VSALTGGAVADDAARRTAAFTAFQQQVLQWSPIAGLGNPQESMAVRIVRQAVTRYRRC
jgi:hypothetical protein